MARRRFISGFASLVVRFAHIAGFYSSKKSMNDYLTMILTGTVKIFKTRERRLKKMVASDGSSDES